MKRKLLFAVMTLITGAWSLSANAQEDITSQYLTNADLSTVGTGWTYFSDSYKYGAWRNHNTETVTPCVEFYAGWGTLEHTDFKFSQTVTLPAGDYRIAVNAFFRNTNDGDGTNPNRAWIFAGTKTQNVVGLTNGGLSTWSSAGDDMDKAAAAFKSGAFSNAFDFTLTEEQTIEIGFQGRFAAIRQWCILGPVKLYKYSLENYLVDYRAAVSTAQGIIDGGKQMDADVLAALQAAMVDESTLTTSAQVVSATSTLNDAIAAANASIAKYEAIAANEAAVAGAALDNPITTSFVVNPTFSNGTSPWQSTTGASNQGTASNQTAFPNLPFWENWHSGGNYTGKMYQVIENIPNGVYELDMWAFVNHFGDGTQQYIYANGDKTYLTQGAPLGYKVFTEVTNNTIEIGLEQAAAVNEWMGLDDAVLIYYGSECTVEDVKFGALVQQLDDLKAQIRAITAVPQALIDADEVTLNSYDPSTYTTAAQYEAAITALQAVLAARQTAATSYAKFTELKGYVTALLAVDYTELVSGAHATLEAATTDESNLTTAAAIDQAYTDLKDATMTYVANADPATGAQFDLTFLLVNPDVTSFWDGTWGIRPDGWYNDQDGGNFQVMANEKMGPGGEVFMEYWRGDAAQNGFVLYQKVTLPEGTYKMAGRVAANFDGQAGTVQNVFFAANETLGTQITSQTLMDAETEFVNTTDGTEVKIGMVATSGNQARWMAINKIQLYKVPAKSYTVGDDTWDITKSGAGDVTLNRSIQNGWNAYILPFNMSQAEVETYFGEGAQVKLVKEYIADTEKLKFETIEGLRANVPCLIKATISAAAGTVIPARTIVPATEVVYNGTNVTMTGCYANQTNVPTNGIFVQGAKLVYNSGADGFNFVYSTRAYITLNGWTPGAQGIKGLNIDFGDDEATGIATIENGELKFLTGKAYDLSGREVKNPTKGLYIIDGKKVFLK